MQYALSEHALRNTLRLQLRSHPLLAGLGEALPGMIALEVTSPYPDGGH